LDPSYLLPLAAPVEVWHLPAVAMSADTSAVKQLEVTMSADGLWCGVVVWAELLLFNNISLSTAGEQWRREPPRDFCLLITSVA
jgi:hypothetical protein